MKALRHAGIYVVLSLLPGCHPNRVPKAPTFTEHVAPILRAHCVSCHHPAGSAPFSLTTYDDAKAHAPLLAAAVRAGRMPPWLPDSSDFAFADDRRLSFRDRVVLERWVQQNTPRGAGVDDQIEFARREQWPLGAPDMIVELPAAYSPSHSGDVFRNFVLPVNTPGERYVRAVDIDPGNARIVHHLILSVDSTPTSRQEDARDVEPGFEGMFSRHAARPPAGFFVGWTPGRVARENVSGLAWRLRGGSDLVVQTHLRVHSTDTKVRPRVALYFADQPPDRTPALIRLGSQTIDIPAGNAAYEVNDSITLPVAVDALGLYPHAHYLAKEMHVSALLPDGKPRVLLRIHDWDFNWQDAYYFREPVRLPAGTKLRLRYTYDNSAQNPRNPNQPPKRVVYGPNTTDEMAELWLQVIPRREADLPALQRALAQKSVHDRVQGWEHLIQIDPNDAIAHASLAAYYSSTRNEQQAVEHYHRAIQAQPDFASAHYNLALLLEKSGQLVNAVEHYQAALDARPDHTGAHNNLANVLLALKREREAATHYREAIRLDSTQVEAYNNLGRLLTQSGQTSQAIRYFEKAIANDPRVSSPRFNLALALASLGRTTEALQQFEAGVRLRPNALDAYLPLAWMLATHPSSEVRRPQQAVLLAERAAQLHGRPNAQIADVLGAAYAAVGDFKRGLEFAQIAHKLASAASDPDMTSQIEARIHLYERRRPYIGRSP